MTTKLIAIGESTALPLAIVIGVDTPIGLTVIRELGQHGVPIVAVARR